LAIEGVAWYFWSHRNPAQDSAAAGAVLPAGGQSLRLSGSNTIGAELGPALVEGWLASRGGSNIQRRPGSADEMQVSGSTGGRHVTIGIKAHGSKTAFADLAAGACDIGMSSRPITSDEAATLQSKGLGDLTSNTNEKVIGLDGVAVIVNDANGIDSLRKD